MFDARQRRGTSGFPKVLRRVGRVPCQSEELDRGLPSVGRDAGQASSLTRPAHDRRGCRKNRDVVRLPAPTLLCADSGNDRPTPTAIEMSMRLPIRTPMLSRAAGGRSCRGDQLGREARSAEDRPIREFPECSASASSSGDGRCKQYRRFYPNQSSRAGATRNRSR